MMRYYLSSSHLGTAPEELVALLKGDTHVAVIANACDATDPAERRGRVEWEAAILRGIGLDPEELDLRNFFGRAGHLSAALSAFVAVWVLSGNVLFADGIP
jgi:dipeptidase E